jgi:hypothetical protein
MFCIERSISIQQGQIAPSPSSAAKMPALIIEQERRPVCNGRPADNCGLPVYIFHPAFAEFLLELTNPSLILTADDYRKTQEYITLSSSFYPTELVRQDAIITSLKAAMSFDLFSVKNRDGTWPDGTIMMPTTVREVHAPVGIWELKNEIGSGGSDPSIQGALSYRKIWAVEDVCCMPTSAI